MKARAIFLGAAFISLAAAQQTANKGMDPARLAAIPARMQSFVDRGDLSGTVTLIARHGSIVHLEATGYQDIEAKKPMRTDTIFQIMSITKPVTAIGIMMLMEEGRLALTDPVDKYVTEFRGQTFNGKKLEHPITIRDLMAHTSGMPMWPRGDTYLYRKMDRTLEQTMASFAEEPLGFEPGTKWGYSSPGMAVLGRVIEVVTGQKYDQFITGRLLKPLEMKDSFYYPPADKQGRIAALYGRRDGKLAKMDVALGGDPFNYRKGAVYPAPEWGLFSTATDMASLFQMMLNGGTLRGKRYLSPASVTAMITLQTGDLKAGFLPGTGYGLAFEVVKDPIGTLTLLSPGAYGHSGIYGTHCWADPKKDLVGVFLIQSGNENIFMAAKNAFFQMAGAAVMD
jgi:CubicO group peptidase (beta-lactamase class C family)